jgi:aspartate racemase
MAERIGILGGLTPESTVTYYLHIVHSYQRRFGDHAFPEIVVYSLSFQRFEDWMEAGEWDRIAEALLSGLERLAAAGAGFAVMATNTMHLHYDRLVRESPIPLGTESPPSCRKKKTGNTSTELSWMSSRGA